jgi:hypothetical protein
LTGCEIDRLGGTGELSRHKAAFVSKLIIDFGVFNQVKGMYS